MFHVKHFFERIIKMKKAKTKKTKKVSAQSKELKRVKRAVYDLERSGYRFPSEFKESLPTLSWQKLRTFTRSRLYRESTAEVEGEIVSGELAKRLRRKASAKKAVETKRRIKELGLKNVKELRQYEKQHLEKPEIDFETITADYFKQKRKEAEQGKYDEGEIIYQNILDLIDKYPTRGAVYLSNLLSTEIKKYGKKAVMASLANMPMDAVATAQYICIYEDDSEKIHEALHSLADMIKGYISDEEENREEEEVQDEMTDFGDF